LHLYKHFYKENNKLSLIKNVDFQNKLIREKSNLKKIRELNYTNLVDRNSRVDSINESIDKIKNNMHHSESRKMNSTK